MSPIKWTKKEWEDLLAEGITEEELLEAEHFALDRLLDPNPAEPTEEQKRIIHRVLVAMIKTNNKEKMKCLVL